MVTKTPTLRTDDPVWKIVEQKQGERVPMGLRRRYDRWLDDERTAAVPWDDDDLADAIIRKLDEAVRELTPPEPDPGALPILDQADVDRWQVLCLLVAEQARHDRSALYWRTRTLDGDLLDSHEAVHEWIQERAREQGPVHPRYTVVIDGPDVAAQLDDEFRFSGHVDITRAQPLPPLALHYMRGDGSGLTHRVEVADDRDNILASLRSVAEGVARRYTWHPAQAVTWLLTGFVPQLPIVTASDGGTSSRSPRRITMDIDPDLSPELVAQVYRQARRKARRGRRSVTAKGAAVARLFWTTPGVSWRNRLKLWNEEHPDDPYTSAQAMQSTARQTTDRIGRALRGVEGQYGDPDEAAIYPVSGSR